MRDNWKVSYHKGTSLLHVVDKFSISMQFDRYAVDLVLEITVTHFVVY